MLKKKAFSKIPDNTNLILHSDQGWQYQMKQYQHLLKEKGIRQSMSRKGNCLDNSLAENFFGLLKSELFYMKEYKTIEELETDIIEYIDYYNNKRIKGQVKRNESCTIQSSFPSSLIPKKKMSNFWVQYTQAQNYLSYEFKLLNVIEIILEFLK